MIMPSPEATLVPAPQDYDYAGFWRRFVAWWLDMVIIQVCLGILHIAMLSPSAHFANAQDWYQQTWSWQSDNEFYSPPYAGLSLLSGWLYWALLESSPMRATFGKKALRMIVTDIHGNRLSFWRASGRFFGKFISWALCGFGFLMIAFTGRHQGLHDYFVDTLVLTPRLPRVPEPPVVN